MNKSMPPAPRAKPFLDTIGASLLPQKNRNRKGAGANSKPNRDRKGADPGPATATVTCPLADHIRNYAGNMHGGVIAAVAEAAARAALREAFPKGKHATVEMKMNYFRPIVAGDPNAGINATATLHIGDGNLCVASVEVYDNTKNLSAAAIVTMHR